MTDPVLIPGWLRGRKTATPPLPESPIPALAEEVQRQARSVHDQANKLNELMTQLTTNRTQKGQL